MASADSKFDHFLYFYFIIIIIIFLQYLRFNLSNKNVIALIARELAGFTYARSLIINSAKPRAVLKFLVHC